MYMHVPACAEQLSDGLSFNNTFQAAPHDTSFGLL